MLEAHQVVYPEDHDRCKYYECNADGSVVFHNKRLQCEKKEKPKCDNGFEAVLYLDEQCNCQWECQCELLALTQRTKPATLEMS